jgi:plastocyanin
MNSRSLSFKSAARTIGAVALLVGVVSGVSIVAASADGGGGSLRVRMRDNCDPATFVAALPQIPNVCVGDGHVTFDEFAAALADGGHHDWRFQPRSTEVKPGTTLRIENRGGESHSFTEVNAFGKNDLPPFAEVLNSAVPETTFAVPTDPANIPLTFAGPGGTFTVSGLGLGVHRFQCFIHPWMRSTINIKS